MAKIYHVNLTAEERESLLQLIRCGQPPARRVTRARILLLALIFVSAIITPSVENVKGRRPRLLDSWGGRMGVDKGLFFW